MNYIYKFQIVLIVILKICNLASAQYVGGEGRGDIMTERLNFQMGEIDDCLPSAFLISQTTCASSYTINGITYTESGTYSQLLTNSDGCDSLITLNLIISEEILELPVSPEGPFVLCEGETIFLNASPGYNSYSWSNGQLGSTAEINESGTYSVSAADNQGCQFVSKDIVVEVMNLPIASFNYSQPSGYTVIFTNTSSNGNSFLWNFGNNNTSSQENPSFNFPFDGDYLITLIVANQCGNDTIGITITVDKFVNINEITQQLSNIEIMPNPTYGLTLIKGFSAQKETILISIINGVGQLIYKKQINVLNDWSEILELHTLSKGIYFIKLENELGVLSKKLIIL